MFLHRLAVFLVLALGVESFFLPWKMKPHYHSQRSKSATISRSSVGSPQREVSINPSLTDEKVASLFAWVSRAFAGDERYNNLVVALAAVFGDLPEESFPMLLLDEAVAAATEEDELTGAPFSLREREGYSLGAMGAAQWTGTFITRPHALLPIRDFASADQWVKSLPRGCRRTLAKATPEAQNFTVTSRPIMGGKPAPHSSLAHFRCVVEHEVRLIMGAHHQSGDGSTENFEEGPFAGAGFVEAMGEAVGRYMGTTRMAGDIREYRDAQTGKVIAFAHEVRKGSVMRGQWFYATDDAAKRYVWFHSVSDLVKRAVETRQVAPNGGPDKDAESKAERSDIDSEKDARKLLQGLAGSTTFGSPPLSPPAVEVVDLGPSGSDAFSELKEKYGFASVVDWPSAADYLGPFVHSSPDDGDLPPQAAELLESVLRAFK